MLSKEVCMRCVRSKALSEVYEGYAPIGAGDWWSEWSDSDNDRWNFKCIVYCRLFNGKCFKQAYINSLSPEWCPFKLEHAIYTGLVEGEVSADGV